MAGVRHSIDTLIRSCLESVLRETGRTVLAEMPADVRLVGRNALLDSLGLVSLVLEIETRLREQFQAEITILDERAMSSERSPFRTLGSLTDHVLERLSARTE